MNIPTDLLYTKDHEWIRIENNIATVGITDYAQGELGDIILTYISQFFHIIGPWAQRAVPGPRGQ